MLNLFRKHPELIVDGAYPLNAEPPLPKLRASYLTPQTSSTCARMATSPDSTARLTA